MFADGVVGKLDIDEVENAWNDARGSNASCAALSDPAADVNGDGCVDIVDLQAVVAARGQRFSSMPLKATSDTQALLKLSPDSASGNATNGSTAAAFTAGAIVVNSTADAVDAAPSDGVCADSRGRCTFRAAITTANWIQGANRIEFNLTGSAPVLIQMDGNLPTLLMNDRSGGTTIDGYTQSGSHVNTATNGSNATPGVMLRGTGQTNKLVALRIVSADNVVRGIAFQNNYRSIVIENEDAHGNQILGNWIGFTGPGTLASYNGHYNMWIADGAAHNVVGTPALADRNVTGGSIKGLALYGPGTDYNVIQNNVFCIMPNGSATAQCDVGIDFSFGPQHNLIGGSGTRERNVFGRTTQNGIEFAHGVDNPPDETWKNDYNQIIGNWIGFKLDGSYDANYRSGQNSPTTKANDSNGINVADCSSFNLVQGNWIASAWDGINLMWNNEEGDILQGNTIGISPLGQAAPLQRYGVNVRNKAHSHTIVGNTIANAGTYGVALVDSGDGAIEISQNIMSSMTVPAIFLATGSNGGIQPPAITTATTVAVSGTAVAGATVEVYRASRAAGLNGLPAQYLGSATANGSGRWTVAVSIAAGLRVTALQTGVNKNTSALSNNVTVVTATATKPGADFTSSQPSGA